MPSAMYSLNLNWVMEDFQGVYMIVMVLQVVMVIANDDADNLELRSPKERHSPRGLDSG